MLTRKQYIRILHNIWYAGVFVVVCVSLIYAMVGDNSPSDTQVTRRIEQANYCSKKADCTVLSGKCPFGCHVLVHQAEADSVQTLLQQYVSSCVYSCTPIRDYACQKAKCVWVPNEG